MSGASDAIVDQAIAWHLRLAHASDDNWMAFTAWLEADPAHAAAYDRIITDDIYAAPALDLEHYTYYFAWPSHASQTGALRAFRDWLRGVMHGE